MTTPDDPSSCRDGAEAPEANPSARRLARVRLDLVENEVAYAIAQGLPLPNHLFALVDGLYIPEPLEVYRGAYLRRLQALVCSIQDVYGGDGVGEVTMGDQIAYVLDRIYPELATSFSNRRRFVEIAAAVEATRGRLSCLYDWGEDSCVEKPVEDGDDWDEEGPLIDFSSSVKGRYRGSNCEFISRRRIVDLMAQSEDGEAPVTERLGIGQIEARMNDGEAVDEFDAAANANLRALNSLEEHVRRALKTGRFRNPRPMLAPAQILRRNWEEGRFDPMGEACRLKLIIAGLAQLGERDRNEKYGELLEILSPIMEALEVDPEVGAILKAGADLDGPEATVMHFPRTMDRVQEAHAEISRAIDALQAQIDRELNVPDRQQIETIIREAGVLWSNRNYIVPDHVLAITQLYSNIVLANNSAFFGSGFYVENPDYHRALHMLELIIRDHKPGVRLVFPLTCADGADARGSYSEKNVHVLPVDMLPAVSAKKRGPLVQLITAFLDFFVSGSRS